jgi:hypothetical protein
MVEASRSKRGAAANSAAAPARAGRKAARATEPQEAVDVEMPAARATRRSRK